MSASIRGRYLWLLGYVELGAAVKTQGRSKGKEALFYCGRPRRKLEVVLFVLAQVCGSAVEAAKAFAVRRTTRCDLQVSSAFASRKRICMNTLDAWQTE